MADYEVVNSIAVVTCQNPPVNQLSYRLRLGLFSGLQKAENDPNVKAIVIIGGGKTFPAGADVKEFATGEAFKKPVSQFIDECERSSKPVVAAIHGTALGGGLEVALGCHYRVGTSRCKVGFPEVLLGLLPGAGGTQRLPRLIGGLIAAELIVSGQHVSSERAQNIGILDAVVAVGAKDSLQKETATLRRYALEYALKIADDPHQSRMVSKMRCAPVHNFFYEMIRKQSAKQARGMIAPQLCLEAVKAAHECDSFEDGIKKERQLFMKLAMGTQSRALQHLFFAQRQISKVPGVDPKLARPLRKVGIVGCGTMGGGILMNFVQSGIPVVVLEPKQEYLDRGLAVVKANWMRQLKRKKLSKAKLEKYLSLITPTVNYDDFRDADIVIEAVFETFDIKKKVFAQLDRVCSRECIMASNTSYIGLDRIAALTSRPHKVVGTHFFAPANQMQLLENVRHDTTDAVTLATVQSMAKRIRKKGVLVKTCDGFVGNRMFAVEVSEANRLLEEGCFPKQVDDILTEFGWAMGPLRVSDLSGNDIGYKDRENKGYIKNPQSFPMPGYYPTAADILVTEMNRLGLKTGKGYYDYEGRKALPSKQVNDLLVRISREKAIPRRNVDKSEIIERTLYTMVNEGFRILEEGIALRPSDIDVVFVFGYGFPAYRGGPMFWADTVGLKKIRDTLNRYSAQYPQVPYFKPANLLNQLVQSKTTLAKYWNKRQRASKL